MAGSIQGYLKLADNNEVSVDIDNKANNRRPTPATLWGVLRSDGSWKCLLLTGLIAGCLGAITWCRLTEVEMVVINFDVYPIHRTRHMSACEDAFLYIPLGFLVLLYLVYLVECYHSTTRLRLVRTVDSDAICRRVRIMKAAVPVVWWKAVCYHYVRRKRQITRYRNGDAYTTSQVYYERVNSHSASSTFSHAYCGFKDISRNLILDTTSKPIIKVRFSKGFAFSNIEAASEFEDQRSRFFSEHERFDDYMEMREGLDLTGLPTFKEHMVACRDSDRAPWYASQVSFWLMSCLLLSWPLRLIIEYNTADVHYTVTKIFGTNYESSGTNCGVREASHTTHNNLINGPALPSTAQNPLIMTQEFPPPNLAAILCNNHVAVHSEANAVDHINILSLAAKNRQGMSHASTIDSLELYASIRENCALVPSYSEALLLESNQPEVDRLQRDVYLTVNSQDSNLPQTANNNNTNPPSTPNDPNTTDPPSYSTNNDHVDAPTYSATTSLLPEGVEYGASINTRRKIINQICVRNAHFYSNLCCQETERYVSLENTDANNPRPTNMHSSVSSYSLKTRNNNSISHGKLVNRRSWNGFFNSTHRPASTTNIPPRYIYDNPSMTLSPSRPNNNELVDRPQSELYYASPLLQICPDDPFKGRDVTTPTEDPPTYEDALHLPKLHAITRSVTDRDIFSSSRVVLLDSLNNRRSCIETSRDNVRLVYPHTHHSPRQIINMETSL